MSLDPIATLLAEGLDLCVRARKLDEMALHMEMRRQGCTHPEVTRSGTPWLWAQEQYDKDLAEWERRGREALAVLTFEPL